MEWVGTSANADIPLPRNVRRYYIPSTTHGGGGGGFNQNIANNPVNCPGNNWGQGAFRANPVSETEITNVLRVAMRNWLMTGAAPPPSRYPTLTGGNLVEPTQAAMGFPSGVPGVPVVDLPAGELRQPGVRLRLGPELRSRRCAPACRPVCRPTSCTRSRCACRGSMPTATNSVACRRCCATRRSAPISAGTSRWPASIRGRCATTSAA